MTTFDSTHIRINGIYLHVVQAGPPEGELVILLHGFPEFWYGWHNQIQFLADLGFRVWVPDQRGYNLSDKPETVREYAISHLTDDVVGLIRATGQQQAIIIGHDWGASVAWWTALRHPEYVKKLGILNVPHPKVMEDTVKSNPRQLMKSWYIFALQMPFLPEKITGLNNFALPMQALKLSSREDTFTEADFDAYREAWSQPHAMQSMMNWYRAYVRYRPTVPEDWRIHCPTRIIWGENDSFLETKMAHQSATLCDECDVFIINNATHWVQHDNPEHVNRLLEEFIT